MKGKNEKIYLVNELFHHYVVGDGDQVDTAFLLEATGITFPYAQFYVATFQLYHAPVKAVNLKEAQRFHHIATLIHQEILKTTTTPVWFYKMSYRNTLIIMNTNASAAEIRQFFTKMQQWIQDTFALESSWGISLPCHDIEDLWLAAEQAVISAKSASKGNIEAYDNHCSDHHGKLYYPESVENLLIMAIKSNNASAIDCILQLIQDENFIVHSVSPEQVGSLNALIINSLYRFHSQQNDLSGLFISLNDSAANSEGNYRNYFMRLGEVCHSICDTINRKKASQKNTLITQIVQYINQQYTNPSLGLSVVAEQFHISEGYLSSVFKNHVHMGFTDYVEKQRIDAACKLLTSTEKSINDISKEVGYNSVYSFRRAFKRTLNLGPSEFRKQPLL